MIGTRLYCSSLRFRKMQTNNNNQYCKISSKNAYQLVSTQFSYSTSIFHPVSVDDIFYKYFKKHQTCHIRRL